MDREKVIEALGWHYEHTVTGKLVLRNPDGPKAAALLRADATALAEKDRRIEELEAEVRRLRSIMNEEGLYDPELAKIAGKPVKVVEAAANPSKRQFNPLGAEHEQHD